MDSETPVLWHILLTNKPQLVDFHLKRVNSQRQQNGEPLVEYFIPFCFLPRVSDDRHIDASEAVGDINDLRQDFHDYVFIRTTVQGASDMVKSSWSRSMRIPLRHYRDMFGHAIAITNREMQLLIRVFSERRIKFSIGLPLPEDLVGEEVFITDPGTFNGQSARIIGVKHTTDGISLTLGIMMFAGTKELRIPNVSPSSIQMPTNPDDIIGIQFIQNAEDTLLDILSRRVNHKETEESRRQDVAMLNYLFLYSYVTVSNHAVAMRFLSLILICASLRHDPDSVSALVKRVQSLLENSTTLSSELTIRLALSLFIATRNADYRTLAKQTLHQHPIDTPVPIASRHKDSPSPRREEIDETVVDTPNSLSRLLSLCKRLRSRL